VEIATNKSVLESLNITHILSVMLVQDIPKLDLPNQLIRYAVPILDRPNAPLLPELSGAVNFITNALIDPKARVLCHCYAGASRSPTVVIAYLLSSMNMTVDEALNYVRVKRGITRPNPGFVQQLRTWDEDRRNKDVRVAKRRRTGPRQSEGTTHRLRRRDQGVSDLDAG
jgi:protein-tyrosine phosphatase